MKTIHYRFGYIPSKLTLEKIFFLAFYYCFARYLPLSYHPGGRIAKRLRGWCARHLFKSCGRDVNIERGVFFGDGSAIEMGEHSGIGANSRITVNIKIGSSVLMGPECYFLPNETHCIRRVDIPILNQEHEFKEGRIEIGDDVWIGMRCLFLPCKKVGSHSVIGAGAVVCKDIPENVIAGGNPIRIIRGR